jgi:small multidrug resistance family-3 protein
MSIVPKSDATLFVITSIALFFLAALVEIGGGYLVWKWLRERKGILFGIVGGIVLFIYGVIPTFQPAHFGRVYAATEAYLLYRQFFGACL